MAIIPFQTQLDAPLPVVRGNAEYQRSVKELDAIDRIVTASGLEEEVIEHWLALAEERKNARRATEGLRPKLLTGKERVRVQARAIQALRAAILRKLEKSSLRIFCRDVARAPLLQKFCQINRFAEAKVFGKSTLENYEKDIPLELIKRLEALLLTAAAGGGDGQENRLGLDEPIATKACYIDTTCIKVNIHFPVDWVLLRDAVRTLMLAVNLIRRSGIRNRMPEAPEAFIRRINKLSIEMTHAQRRRDSRKKRKAVLRKMKRLVGTVRTHAERHYELLDRNWEQTAWTRKQAEQVLRRIKAILDQLPEAQRQAHERIIGERQVKNEDKILSLYEEDVNVIVRRKAGAAVEFGNTLVIAEQENGVVIDWRMFQDQAPADAKLVLPVMARIDAILGAGRVDLVGTDRGFDSKPNREHLDEADIYNAMCPRNLLDLEERMHDPRFREAQKRRAQTEARIAIVQRCFSGSPMLQKGFAHREQHMGLSILAHNLWVLARMKVAQQEARNSREPRRRRRSA